jgi:nucleoside-diphosphate-sugar epimerase
MNQIEEDIQQLLSKENQEFFSKKSVLITGASGLVGSYLTTFFQNLDSYKSEDLQLYVSSLTGVFTTPILHNTRILKGDITNLEFLKTFPNFDLIIHASGYGQPGKFLENVVKTMKLNSIVTQELCEKLNDSGRFLFISTSEIYSGLDQPPFCESQVGNTNTDHERAPYIESKRFGETAVSNLQKSNRNLLGFSARLALAYGPGVKESDSRVLYNLIQSGMSTGEINLKDSGTAMRTYCYVLDAVEMMLSIIKRGEYPIYNVGGISRLSISDLANKVAVLTNAKLNIPTKSESFLSSAPNDVWLDLSRISEISETTTFVDMEDGLSRTITWLKERAQV